MRVEYDVDNNWVEIYMDGLAVYRGEICEESVDLIANAKIAGVVVEAIPTNFED